MAFTQRIAVLVAVVAVPVGIAAGSHVLTGGQNSPEVPRQVETRSPEPTEPPDRSADHPPGHRSRAPEQTTGNADPSGDPEDTRRRATPDRSANGDGEPSPGDNGRGDLHSRVDDEDDRDDERDDADDRNEG